jgi:hypothetical protein
LLLAALLGQVQPWVLLLLLLLVQVLLLGPAAVETLEGALTVLRLMAHSAVVLLPQGFLGKVLPRRLLLLLVQVLLLGPGSAALQALEGALPVLMLMLMAHPGAVQVLTRLLVLQKVTPC